MLSNVDMEIDFIGQNIESQAIENPASEGILEEITSEKMDSKDNFDEKLLNLSSDSVNESKSESEVDSSSTDSVNDLEWIPLTDDDFEEDFPLGFTNTSNIENLDQEAQNSANASLPLVIQCFCEYFPDSLFRLIVERTNLYAKSKLQMKYDNMPEKERESLRKKII